MVMTMKMIRLSLNRSSEWSTWRKFGEHGEHGEHGKDQPDDIKHSNYDSKHSLCDSKRSICQPDDSKYYIFGHSWRRLQKFITYLPGEHGPDWLKMGEHQTKCRALRKIVVTISTNL